MTADGFADMDAGRTWFAIAGELRPNGPAPLVIVHGGPGATHDYLLPLADLAHSGRPVVFYDQLGNGRSARFPERAGDQKFWTVDLFVRQLHDLVRHLGISRFHLLGHSWGGFIAQELALAPPAELLSLTLVSSAADLQDCVDAAHTLRAELPPEVRQVLDRHESAGTFDSVDYQQACTVYQQRHFCRLAPWPEPLLRTYRLLAQDPAVFATLFGPSPFMLTGSARDWHSAGRLRQLHVPTLVLSGRHDQAVPALQDRLVQEIPVAEQVVFEESSHTCFWEERPLFLEVTRGWLADREVITHTR